MTIPSSSVNIYVASSWRNLIQPIVVQSLKAEGYDVYDFRNPIPGDKGFSWSQIDEKYKQWDTVAYTEALRTEIAQRGFDFDNAALHKCDVVVLVLPCGRSAHLEAGYAAGQGKHVIVLIPSLDEPELMYKLFDNPNNSTPICTTLNEVFTHLKSIRQGG